MSQNTQSHIRVRQIGAAWLILCTVAAGIYYWQSEADSATVLPASVNATETPVSLVSDSKESPIHGTRAIEKIRVGDRVLAHNPEVSEQERANWQEPDWTRCKRLLLEMDYGEGTLHVDLIRPEEWLVEHGARTGGTVELDLPEMGAQGVASVVAVMPCPEIEPGAGQVVTATFAHPPSEDVWDVRFTGDSSCTGVTENHPFWSVDRQTFVPIGEMKIGDRVRTVLGETRQIVSMERRPAPETVYNLEVYADHVYFVGEQGVLAHNTYNLWRRGWFVQQAKKGNEKPFGLVPGRSRTDYDAYGQMPEKEIAFWSKLAESTGHRIVVTGSVAESPWGMMNRYNPAKWVDLPEFRANKFYSNFVERGLGDVDLWGELKKNLDADTLKRVQQEIYDQFGEFPDFYKMEHYATLVGDTNSFKSLGVPAIVFQPNKGGTGVSIARLPAKWELDGF